MERWSVGVLGLSRCHDAITPSIHDSSRPWRREFRWSSARDPRILPRVNTASQNLPHHLGVLRERMLHPTDYELAVNYFLEEFAGDVKFLQQSEPDDASHLLAVLAHVAGQAFGHRVAIENSKVFLLGAHRFYHGNAAVEGRVLLFFYFQEADTGIAALIPGVGGAMEVARFRLTAGLPDPRKN
jgi:hypothetical protein